MADAIFKQCIDAVQSSIKAIGLTGLVDSRVVVRKLPFDDDVTFPAVIISPQAERISPTKGTNIHDQIEYGVGVTIARYSNRNLIDNLEAFLKWREQIRSRFINQRLAGVPEVNTCHVEPGEVMLPAGFAAMYDLQFLVIRCIAWETRG